MNGKHFRCCGISLPCAMHYVMLQGAMSYEDAASIPVNSSAVLYSAGMSSSSDTVYHALGDGAIPFTWV